ncbi:tetratricopeptide repeat protein [Imbroritus primus]|uniref:tetratricopeptide repeat protein n=1 Tax=Imbroritus primus TaxID=3058603 RepID=UPI003D1608E2
MLTARNKRTRLLPPWMIGIFGALIGVGLALAFPRETLQQRLLKQEGGVNGLSIAYLEAWLQIVPDDPEFLAILAQQYVSIGRLDDAEALIRHMRAMPQPVVRRGALLAQIGIAEQRAYAIEPDAPQRAAALNTVRSLMRETANKDWSVGELEGLATRARALGLGDLALGFYKQLVQTDTARAEMWQKTVGEMALGTGDYRSAAQAMFAQQAAADTLPLRRRYFIDGLRVLQSGNMLDEAMRQAEARLGDLRNDAETLRFLTRLAMSANRPDLAERYARRLLSIGAQPQISSRGQTPLEQRGFVFLDGPRGLAMREAMGQHGVRHVQAGAGDVLAPGKSFNQEDYELAYNVFIGNGKPVDARRIAEAAVRYQPNSLVWRERLAQTAEWSGSPGQALEQWLWLAEHGGGTKAWQAVLRLAPGLNDDRAYLAALRHRVRTERGNLELVDQISSAYERLGEPEAALAFLKESATGPRRREVLERYGELAERAGKDDIAIQTYRDLAKEPGSGTVAATRLSRMLYIRGDLKGATDVLVQVRNRATATDEEYWRQLARMATLTRREALAREAYGKLAETGKANAKELGEMANLYADRPLDAGRVAEQSYRMSGDMFMLQQALMYYNQARAYGRIEALFASMTPEQRAAAEKSPLVLVQRAEYLRATGQRSAALADLTAANALDAAGTDARAALLWMLVDQGKTEDLKAAMKNWAADAEDDPDLWGPYGAAYLRLNDGRRAFHYLRKNAAQRSQDPLWMLAYADAAEMVGYVDVAWAVRRKVWLDMRAAGIPQGVLDPRSNKVASQSLGGASEAEDADIREQLRAQSVTLAQVFESGDLSRRILIEFLRADRAAGDKSASAQEGAQTERYSQTAREVALSWAMSREQNELGRAWLARHYAETLDRPAYADLAIALGDRDRPAVEKILDELPDRLPLTTRIDANRYVDRLGEAQRLAFNGLDTAPDSEEMHQRLRESMLVNAQALSIGTTFSRQRPLAFTETVVGAGVRLSDRFTLGARYGYRQQRSTDGQNLVNVPSADHNLEAVLGYRINAVNWQLAAGRRMGVEDVTTGRFDIAWNPEIPVSFTGFVGVNQAATENAYLRVGGVKDVAGIGANWRVSTRDYLAARVEGNRFFGQDRTSIGHGTIFELEAGHRFRIEYPDYTVRAVVTRGNYSSKQDAGRVLRSLTPDPNAVASDFMPRSFTQAGLLFSFGTEHLDEYSRGLRPFLEAGLLRDSREGWGTRVQLGVGGSVLGNDHASVYYAREGVTRGGGAPLNEFGIRYRWLY